jgi:hypothetical protein
VKEGRKKVKKLARRVGYGKKMAREGLGERKNYFD